MFSKNEVNSRPNRFGGDSILIDMNGDLYPDILLPESANGVGAGQVSWYENPATGDLTGVWTEHVVGTWDGSGGVGSPAHMSEIYAGDLDGDGDVDIVTRDVNNGVHILANDGAGVFSRHFLATNPREGLDLFDPDQDGDLDGDLDLLSSISQVGQGNEPAEVFVYLNNGDGTTWTKMAVDAVNIYSGVFVDFDGDGDADIVGPDNWKSGELRFFESNATQLLSALPGDYNHDGLVDAADLAVWVTAFGTSVTNAFEGADGDGDLDMDGPDFLIWQRRFGESLDPFQATGTQVPEPSTQWLFGFAALTLAPLREFFRCCWLLERGLTQRR